MDTPASFQSRPCLEEEEDEEEAPGAGICRPEGRVAGPGAQSKVNINIIEGFPHDNNSSHVNLQPREEVAEGQGVDGEDRGVCATCGLREPNTGGARVINWVQCDSCQQWFHDGCVGWEEEATGDFLCRECEHIEDGGSTKLTFEKQEDGWQIKKKTSPSKRERKRRQGEAAKRSKKIKERWVLTKE